MFALSIFFQTVSYILYATSQNIENYFVNPPPRLALFNLPNLTNIFLVSDSRLIRRNRLHRLRSNTASLHRRLNQPRQPCVLVHPPRNHYDAASTLPRLPHRRRVSQKDWLALVLWHLGNCGAVRCGAANRHHGSAADEGQETRPSCIAEPGGCKWLFSG